MTYKRLLKYGLALYIITQVVPGIVGGLIASLYITGVL